MLNTKGPIIAKFIVLLCKQFIYRQRCKQKNITFQHFKEYVYKIENIEKYIAVKNNKTVLHNKKWCRVAGIPQILNI